MTSAGRCVLLTALLISCNETALGPARECFGPLAVTVSSGTQPVFTWTVQCAVAHLAVFAPPVADETPVAWDVRSDPPRIVSPVRYGERPGGATEIQAPAALRPGERYQVRVYSAAHVAIGTASFVP